jgi:hypothetical protein
MQHLVDYMLKVWHILKIIEHIGIVHVRVVTNVLKWVNIYWMEVQNLVVV